MPPFPPDATFQPGERADFEASLRPDSADDSNRLQNAWRPAQKGNRLLKEHTCPVTYPDGLTGLCRYEREAPAVHRFRFIDAAGKILATVWHTEKLPAAIEAIETRATELIPRAFAEIIERERKEYFARASAGPDRAPRPERFQMAAARAKQVGGKYALCVPLGEAKERLLSVTKTFDTMEEANQAWRERGDERLVVACGNRLDRCWERPRRNVLYREIHEMAYQAKTPLNGGCPASPTD